MRAGNNSLNKIFQVLQDPMKLHRKYTLAECVSTVELAKGKGKLTFKTKTYFGSLSVAAVWLQRLSIIY